MPDRWVTPAQPRRVRCASTGLTFSPSAFSHPHLLVVYSPGWQPVIHYPLLDTPTDPGVSIATIQERLHGLDHPVRLRLLRSLARGPHTTGELADIWMLTAPEVSRHLAVLKRTGVPFVGGAITM